MVKSWFRFLNPNKPFDQYQNTEIKVHTSTVPGLKLPESRKGKASKCTWLLYSVIEVHTGYYGSIDEVMVPDWSDPGK